MHLRCACLQLTICTACGVAAPVAAAKPIFLQIEGAQSQQRRPSPSYQQHHAVSQQHSEPHQAARNSNSPDVMYPMSSSYSSNEHRRLDAASHSSSNGLPDYRASQQDRSQLSQRGPPPETVNHSAWGAAPSQQRHDTRSEYADVNPERGYSRNQAAAGDDAASRGQLGSSSVQTLSPPSASAAEAKKAAYR